MVVGIGIGYGIGVIRIGYGVGIGMVGIVWGRNWWGWCRRGVVLMIVFNKVVGGFKMKFIDMWVVSGWWMLIVGVIIGEKFVYFGVDVKLGFYIIVYFVYFFWWVVVKEWVVNVKVVVIGINWFKKIFI